MSTNFLGGGVVLDEAGRPLDQIIVTGITATGFHGVFEHERREGQTFSADVVVHLDTRRAAAGDALDRTVDYGVLAEAVAGVLSGEPADLVETVAERIAATALADPSVAAVDVAVHKPQAPITVPFDDVVVRIHRDRNKLPAAEPWRRPAEERRVPPPAAPATTATADGATGEVPPTSRPTPAVEHPDRLDEAPAAPVEAVLALGANLGNAQGTLREAVADVERVAGVEIVAVSPLARTAAVGGPAQPDYLNAVVIVQTTLAPRALLHAVQAIELHHGRERREHWGPRTLDIDLITYGSTLAVTDDLELPHPRAHQRAFVLQPWAQVAPQAVLPGLGGGPVSALAATAPDRDGVRWMALDWMTAPLPAGPREHEAVDPARAVPPPADSSTHRAPHAHVAGDPRPPSGAHALVAPSSSGAHAHVAPSSPDAAIAGPVAAAASVAAAGPALAPALEPGHAPQQDTRQGPASPSTTDGVGLPAPDHHAGRIEPASGLPDAAHEPDAEPDLDADARQDAEPDARQDAEPDAGPRTAGASDGPLDWLPALPTPGAGTGARAPIFSPVVAPDDVPHPGDRHP
ncbi:2-amino-4-hydroxy-6-hydroxymethyldihydropteridine diphosphokinase [Cellulomonas aerilata]|uniref:Bifunctional folate synthesis protein n=1 Tax=Cellulomonas aerilata TaxID=515326 RepID=A0A512DEJ7_9CELL|nr:2-amino-4-hydroxy-6-hydroxymethyldihydropteridine diphosphokinase [Cellulomonas aerilata]GEO34889.1 hypothetical protein CAE01nite_26140 [Cellulomonas aerilata]